VRSWCTRIATNVATSATAAINDFISASFQSFFGLFTDTFVAIAESTSQSSYNFRSAAASVLTDLIADFVSSFFTNTFISIIQSVNHGTDDFWIATTVVVVTQFINSISTIFCVTGSLRFVDQLGNFARISIATFGFAAAVATRIAAARAAKFLAKQFAEKPATIPAKAAR
jgi:hypothetical protein